MELSPEHAEIFREIVADAEAEGFTLALDGMDALYGFLAAREGRRLSPSLVARFMRLAREVDPPTAHQLREQLHRSANADDELDGDRQHARDILDVLWDEPWWREESA